MSLPVFQMVIDATDKEGYGLKFTTELEDYLPPVFTIPVSLAASNDPVQLPRHYYMPGELNGIFRNYSAVLNETGTLLEINDPELGQNVRFLLDHEMRNFDLPYSFNILRYIGNESDLLEGYERFILLMPIDLSVMDDLYNLKEACFVGRTPVFGNNADLTINNL